VYTLRRMVAHMTESDDSGYAGAYEQMLSQFRQYDSNEEFLNVLPGSNVPAGANSRYY
jgi:hypothetical protein